MMVAAFPSAVLAAVSSTLTAQNDFGATSSGDALVTLCAGQSKHEATTLTSCGADLATTCAGQSMQETTTMTSSMAEMLSQIKMEAAWAVWKEACNLHPTQLFGERWRRFLLQHLFAMDFVFRCVRETMVLEQENDGSYEMKKHTDAIFEILFKQLMDEIQVRFVLQQQGLLQDALESDEPQQDREENNADETGTQGDASGSTEDVSRDIDLSSGNDKGMKRSYYRDFEAQKRTSKRLSALQLKPMDHCEEEWQTDLSPCKQKMRKKLKKR